MPRRRRPCSRSARRCNRRRSRLDPWPARDQRRTWLLYSGEWPEAAFSAQVLGAGDTYGVAHWRVASRDRALDGVLVAALDDRGRCTSLRQWWHESANSPK